MFRSVEMPTILISSVNQWVNVMTEKASKKPTAGARKAAAKAVEPRRSPAKRSAGKPVLLSGGNPQIPKGYGDAPVQAYIAAMPDWKNEVGRRLDAIIARTVPGVR